MRIFFFANRRLERDWLLRNLQNLANLRNRNVHLLGNLFARRFAPEFLHQRARRSDKLIDRFDHVHGNANGARLVGDRAGDGLTNPPCRVSRKLIAAPPLKLIDGLHQTDVAFLNQIEKLQTAVGIFLRDGNDETQVGLHQFALCLASVLLAGNDVLKRPLHVDGRNVEFLLDRAQTLLGICDMLFVSLLIVGLQTFFR